MTAGSWMVAMKRRRLGHPAAAAARAEAAPLTGNRHQVIESATLAPKARHAAFERATRQKLPELPLDEVREAHSVPGLGDRTQ
jgi:hypothetical protein